MKRLLLLFVILMNAAAASAQGEFTLKGSVRDRATSGYVIMAKIECLNDQDSVIGEAWAISHDYDYRRQASTEKGIFWMDIPRQKGRYTLRFTHEEYDTITAPLDLTNIGAREYDREIGVYYMDRPKQTTLKEVEVKASRILFYNRGDTIVYNASAFQLAEGSMLDVLIEQLPGVELREGGQIYVNGKFVQSLLLNGKDFFKGNNQLMLDNLSAYTVKNIEVYKKQTDRARFLGLEDEENKELVMDVKLKKEYIGGWNINTEMAGGTEGRYLGRLFAMHFTALSQLTVIGNVNNLNDDSRPTAEDSWDPDQMSDGEWRHHEGGVDYSVENDDGSRKASGNIMVSQQRQYGESVNNTVSFLPQQNTYSQGSATMLDRSLDLKTSHQLYMQTSGVALTFSPNISWTHDRGWQESQSQSALDDSYRQLINSTLSKSNTHNQYLNLGATLRATIKIPRTSDAIDLYGSFGHRTSDSNNESYNIIRYGDPTMTPDCRRQKTETDPTHNTNYMLGVRYNLILSNALNFGLTYEYSAVRDKETSAYYLARLDASHTGDYTLDNLYSLQMTFDPTNSNVSHAHSDLHEIRPSLSWQPIKHWSLAVTAPLNFVNKSLLYRQDGQDYPADLKKTYFDSVHGSITYERSDDETGYTGFSLGYSRDSSLPRLENMITLPNTRNPLSLYLGNPDLRPSVTDDFSVMFQKSTRSNFTSYIYASYRMVNDAIVSGYTYDTTTGRRTYKNYNVDGSHMLYSTLYLSWYWNKYNWRVSLQLNNTLNRSLSMVGADTTEPSLVTLDSYSMYPRFELTKYFGGGRSKYISLMLNPNIRHTRSSDINATNINPRTGKYMLSGKCDLPYGWSLSTSLRLTTRDGYNDPQVRRCEWIWNGRVTKSFLSGRLLASVIAYDMLHQRSAYNCYVSPQMRTEYFTNTIPRYVLLDIQYKINIQPKKKIAQTTHFY